MGVGVGSLGGEGQPGNVYIFFCDFTEKFLKLRIEMRIYGKILT
jgi:hypothetical protein